MGINRAGVRSARTRGARIRNRRIAPLGGQCGAVGQGQHAGQDQIKGPGLAPAQADVSLGQQGIHADQQKKSGTAQAANHDVTAHLEPPCDSPRRRTISQTPSPISSSGQANAMRRPWKISNCPSRNSSPRAISTMAPTGSLRCQNRGRQHSGGGGGTAGSTKPAGGGVNGACQGACQGGWYCPAYGG